jgi:hypothetical protein
MLSRVLMARLLHVAILRICSCLLDSVQQQLICHALQTARSVEAQHVHVQQRI